jgi:hypothetical protein
VSEHATFSDRLLAVQTGLIGIAVAILLAGIPFAYSVQGRLSSVETNVANAATNVKDIGGDLKAMAINSARLDTHERRLDRLEARTP